MEAVVESDLETIFAMFVQERIKAFIVILLIFSIPIIRAHENFWERISTVKGYQQEVDSSSSDRRNKWRQALILVKKYPYSGVGLARFRDAVRYHGLGEFEHIVHNAYLEIGAEAGVVSMLLFIACLYLGIRRSILAGKCFKNRGDYKMLQISNAIWVSLASMAFSLIFLSEQYNSMLFILLGLSSCVHRLVLQVAPAE